MYVAFYSIFVFEGAAVLLINDPSGDYTANGKRGGRKRQSESPTNSPITEDIVSEMGFERTCPAAIDASQSRYIPVGIKIDLGDRKQGRSTLGSDRA